MKRKQIGKIQVGLGYALLIVTIIGAFLIVNYGIFGVVNSVGNRFVDDSFIAQEKMEQAGTLPSDYGMNMSSVMRLGVLITMLTLFLFGTQVFILLVLSAMLILQGKANMQK